MTTTNNKRTHHENSRTKHMKHTSSAPAHVTPPHQKHHVPLPDHAKQTITRPSRRSVKESGSTTRDSIITAAYDLFREKGLAKMSLSELARRVGMDQSSLYYYFPSKEVLLSKISHSTIDVPTLEALSRYSSSHSAYLYALIMQDVVEKCEMPIDFIEMESAARNQPEAFALFFARYKKIYSALTDIIQAGIDANEFRPCAADERAVTILSVNEGLQHHFHAKQRGELLLAESGYTAHNYSPEDIGHLSAQSIIPGLTIQHIDLNEVAKEGQRLYARIMQRTLE